MRFKFLIIIFGLFYSSQISATLRTNCNEMFGILEKDRVKGKPWLFKRDTMETAKNFEKSYRRYAKDQNFKKCLYAFLEKDMDKHYYIALFLYLKEYTSSPDLILAEEIFNRGIRNFTINCEIPYNLSDPNAERCMQLTSLHFMYGYLHWQKGNKFKAGHHFQTAAEIVIHNPGGLPAIEEKEMEEIVKEFNLQF